MLVLSRLRDERVIIVLPDGRIITVTISDIRGDKVRLGFEADRDIFVHREEVYREILAEAANK